MIKRFLRYFRPYRFLFWTDMAAALVLSLCNLVYPRFTATMLDELIPAAAGDSAALSAIFVAGVAVLALYLLKAGMNYYMSYYGHVMGVKMQADMRRDMFAHMERLDCTFFDNNKTGSLMSRMTNDLMDVTELAHHGPEDLFISTVQLVGAMVLMLMIHPWLTLISFLPIPFMIWFISKKRRAMNRAFTQSREEIAEVNAGLENSISGIRVSKAYDAAASEQEKFDRANGRFVTARTGAYKVMGSFASVNELITDILYLLVLIAGGVFVSKGQITVTGLVTFILYVNVFIQPIRRMIGFVEQYQNGMTGFARFCAIMDTPAEEDSPDAVELKNTRGEIAFSDVTFSYRDSGRVLDGVSFTIPRGHTLALVGASGGGKTTVCHLLPRFYEIEGGSISVDGRDIRSYTRASLRRSIGLVSQDVFLFYASIYDNIAYGRPDATRQEVEQAARFASLTDFIESLPDGYDTLVGERGVKLSGGQKQRISIARVFLKNPQILILDEATSALDNVTEAQIQSAIATLSQGRTILVVAHRLSTVRHADEILLLEGGQVAERGTHDQLMAKGGKYAELSNQTIS